MVELVVTSIRELEDAIATTFANDTACFRGQSSVAWELVPTAYRAMIPFAGQAGFDPTVAAEVERDTYREFEMEAIRTLPSLDTFERLSVAQHHGIPTRFLDWTSNLAIAAFFAVSGEDTEDAAVWALNLSQFPFPPTMGRQHRGGGYTLEKIKEYGRGTVASFARPVSRPIVSSMPTAPPTTSPQGTFVIWKPARVDDRLSRQEGLLSWYHSFEDADVVWNYSSHIISLEVKLGLNLLVKLKIPANKRKPVREELLRRGINEHILYADLDGLGKRLAREHDETISDYLSP